MNELVYDGKSYTSEDITAGVGRLELTHAMVGETLAVDELYLL